MRYEILRLVRLGGLVQKSDDNLLSGKGAIIMNTKQTNPEPMMQDQLVYVREQIIKTYLFLISHTEHDPKVIEVMKLSALADVQRRYEAGELW